MNDEIKENGSTSEGKISWRKILCWVALMLSTMVPIASIGAAITSLSLETDDKKDEAPIVCYIALGVSCFILIMGFISDIIFQL